MSKIAPCLWFDGEAEEAAKFYTSLLPDSRIDHVQKNVTDSPAGKAGSVLIVKFTLAALPAGLSDGGSTERCGWLKDRYGVSWQIVPSVLPQLLGDPDPAKAQRVMQAMLQMIKLDIAGLEKAGDGAV